MLCAGECGFGVEPEPLGVDQRADCASHVDDAGTDRDRYLMVATMVRKAESIRDRRANDFSEVVGVIGVGARQHHRDGVVAVPREPVVLTERLANQHAEPLQDTVADDAAVLVVELRETIDVEDHERERVAKPPGPVRLLRQDHVEERPRMHCRQRIDDGRLLGGGGRLRCDRAQHVERRPANELRDAGPAFGRNPEVGVERQLVEDGSLHVMDKSENISGMEILLGRCTAKGADTRVLGVDAAAIDGARQQIRGDVGRALRAFDRSTRCGVTAASWRDDRDVSGDQIAPLAQSRRDTLTEIGFDGAMFTDLIDAAQPAARRSVR